jgi:hypothetical protein
VLKYGDGDVIMGLDEVENSAVNDEGWALL